MSTDDPYTPTKAIPRSEPERPMMWNEQPGPEMLIAFQMVYHSAWEAADPKALAKQAIDVATALVAEGRARGLMHPTVPGARGKAVRLQVVPSVADPQEPE